MKRYLIALIHYMEELDYKKVFETLVEETSNYLTKNHLKAMVLGISGGIDSTVVAAICNEVSKRTGTPLIGRSLPIKNSESESRVASLVGHAFCDDFKVVNLWESYNTMLEDIAYGEYNRDVYGHFSNTQVEVPEQTPIANGNIQARLRMIYLYNIASIKKGLVISTDNQSEYQLGFWTIHGDVGDFNPLQDLWKTEVYKLAKYIKEYILHKVERLRIDEKSRKLLMVPVTKQIEAISMSMDLIPTDGLGISDSDLDQIGASSYNDVDEILQTYPDNYKELCDKFSKEVVDKVIDRHTKSEFKRLKAPIYIPRRKYE